MDDSQSDRFTSSLDLLEATHDFPCDFMLKVIGRLDDQFVARVVAAVRECIDADVDPPFRVRETPAGRHVAVTLEPRVDSAAQVLALYERVREIEGVVILM